MTLPPSAWGCGTLVLASDGSVHASDDVAKAWCAGRAWEAMLSPGSAAYWTMAVEPLLLTTGQVADVALELADGQRVLAFAFRDDQTHVLLVPVEGRRRYEEALQEAADRAAESQRALNRLRDQNAMRIDFLNSISHELATPMTPVKLQLAALERRLEGQDRAILDKLAASLRRVERFHERLQEAAGLQARRVPVNMQDVSLDGLLDAVVGRWPAQDRVELQTAPTTARGDPQAIQRCITHVLENALKFSPPHTPIQVRVRDGAITVRDAGRGMTQEQLAQVGRPFHKLHDDHEFAGLGAGLGLYVVQGLMAAMDGTLEVTSPGPDQGVVVTLGFRS